MSIEKTCCITGHREFPMEKRIYIQNEMDRAIRIALGDGYTHFISGFAQGIDLTFARLVSEYKRDLEITLEAAIPYKGRLKSEDAFFQKYLTACDEVHVVCEDYHSGCYHQRNDYMLEKSGRVIAIYDGRQSGGTFYTLKKAEKLGREIILIKI